MTYAINPNWKTHSTTDVNSGNDGLEVLIAGWIHQKRDKGQLIFLTLRDPDGLAQITLHAKKVGPEVFKLAKDLKASWLNIDMIMENGRFLITEFSPVWHHYAYKEKPSFVYKEDYNIDIPLKVSLDLERIIVNSLINEVKKEREELIF